MPAVAAHGQLAAQVADLVDLDEARVFFQVDRMKVRMVSCQEEQAAATPAAASVTNRRRDNFFASALTIYLYCQPRMFQKK